MIHERATTLLDRMGYHKTLYTSAEVRQIAADEALSESDYSALHRYADALEETATSTPAQQVAAALSSAEAEREVCQTLIRQAVGRYMKATGFRVLGADIVTYEVSALGDTLRQFAVGHVAIEIEKDLRFQS